MRRSHGRLAAPALAAVVLVLGPAFAALCSADDETLAAGEASSRTSHLGRLGVGLRFDGFRLEETRRPGPDGTLDNANRATNFLGTLWGLDARQSAVPRPFAELRLWRGLTLGVEYDQQRARTLDWSNDEKTATAGDGDVQIRGGLAYAAWHLRFARRWTAHVRAGGARYWSRFFVSPGWAPGPDRYFLVEDTDGWFAGAGCRFALSRHVRLEAGVRHLHARDVEARAVISERRRQYRDGRFPMRSDAAHLGAVYAF